MALKRGLCCKGELKLMVKEELIVCSVISFSQSIIGWSSTSEREAAECRVKWQRSYCFWLHCFFCCSFKWERTLKDPCYTCTRTFIFQLRLKRSITKLSKSPDFSLAQWTKTSRRPWNSIGTNTWWSVLQLTREFSRTATHTWTEACKRETALLLEDSLTCSRKLL